jgi:hypothetical protein
MSRELWQNIRQLLHTTNSNGLRHWLNATMASGWSDAEVIQDTMDDNFQMVFVARMADALLDVITAVDPYPCIAHTPYDGSISLTS